MDNGSVEAIAKLKEEGMVIDFDGKKFARQGFQRLIDNPRPSAINGTTLSGLVDYIKADKEAFKPASCMIQIRDYSEVSLFEAFDGEDQERTVFYRAKLDKELPAFPFDVYLESEDFIIKARSRMQPSDDMDKIIEIVSKLAVQEKIIAKDDGLSQVVQTKRGVSGGVTDPTETKGTYSLKPYRTFREINQPESKFILRLKAREDGIPTVALFDSEGGIWRYHAMLAIKDWLEVELGKDIPIFA